MGLSVDMSAHIAHRFLDTSGGTTVDKTVGPESAADRVERTLWVLGASVFNGGWSTLMAVLPLVFTSSTVRGAGSAAACAAHHAGARVGAVGWGADARHTHARGKQIFEVFFKMMTCIVRHRTAVPRRCGADCGRALTPRAVLAQSLAVTCCTGSAGARSRLGTASRAAVNLHVWINWLHLHTSTLESPRPC